MLWHQVDNLKYPVDRNYCTHPCFVGVKTSLDVKHVDIWSRRIDASTIRINIDVGRRTSKWLTISENGGISWVRIDGSDDDANLSNIAAC